MEFFEYDYVNGSLVLKYEEILMIKDLAALLEPKRNSVTGDVAGKKSLRAIKEFKFLYLFFNWKSPYFSYGEAERYNESVKDSGLTSTELENQEFKTACKKYDELKNSSLEIRLLRSTMNSVENVIHYLENIDLAERDPISGKPIFKTKDLIAEIKGCKDLISSLRELELQVKKGMEKENTLRGNAEVGLFD